MLRSPWRTAIGPPGRARLPRCRFMLPPVPPAGPARSSRAGQWSTAWQVPGPAAGQTRTWMRRTRTRNLNGGARNGTSGLGLSDREPVRSAEARTTITVQASGQRPLPRRYSVAHRRRRDRRSSRGGGGGHGDTVTVTSRVCAAAAETHEDSEARGGGGGGAWHRAGAAAEAVEAPRGGGQRAEARRIEGQQGCVETVGEDPNQGRPRPRRRRRLCVAPGRIFHALSRSLSLSLSLSLSMRKIAPSPCA